MNAVPPGLAFAGRPPRHLRCSRTVALGFASVEYGARHKHVEFLLVEVRAKPVSTVACRNSGEPQYVSLCWPSCDGHSVYWHHLSVPVIISITPLLLLSSFYF